MLFRSPDISFVGALGPYPGQAGVRVGDATLVEDVNEAAVEETVLDRCVRTILLEDLVRIEGTVGLVTTNHVQEVACKCGGRCRNVSYLFRKDHIFEKPNFGYMNKYEKNNSKSYHLEY